MVKVVLRCIAVVVWPVVSLWPNLTPDFVCWFSRTFFDVHDYTENRGGDGIPTHFHTYTCWHCGKQFTI
jgi:hypothetical protein